MQNRSINRFSGFVSRDLYIFSKTILSQISLLFKGRMENFIKVVDYLLKICYNYYVKILRKSLRTGALPLGAY